jgi:serine/threonine-protein kinase
MLETATTVSGTPAYMAPEMLEPAPWRVDARTDVYLLGAVLHHILTGIPRHQGKTVQEMLQRVYDSEPVDFPPEVPAELAAICNRATHATKSKRYESADELRRAVGEFLTHRASARLEANAFDRLRRLEEALSRPRFERDETEMYTYAEEARFGFRAALAAWPENADARVGLDATSTTMIGWALETGNLQSARLLYGELDEKDRRLERRIEEHVAARAGRVEELNTLRLKQAEYDPIAGRRARGRLAVALGALWLVVPAGVYHLAATDRIEYSYEVSAISQGFAWLVTLGLLFVFRRELSVGKVNRRLMVALLALIPVMALTALVARGVGVTALQSVPLRTMALAGACAVMGIAIDIRMLGAAAAFALASLCSILRPDLAVLLQALGNLAALVSVGLAWSVGDGPSKEVQFDRDLLTATAKLPPVAVPRDQP